MIAVQIDPERAWDMALFSFRASTEAICEMAKSPDFRDMTSPQSSHPPASLSPSPLEKGEAAFTQAAAASPAIIKSWVHPDWPSVTQYEIDAPTSASCQIAISDIMDRVGDEGGMAVFETPSRRYSVFDGGKRWRSQGYATRLA